jgi:hypothetical protein
MPTRPAAPPEWATNGGTRTVPTLARQGTGWVSGEPIDPLQCNDLWGEAFDWIGYLADIIPASNVIEAEVFRVVDPAGPTTRGALTWDTIGGNAGVAVGSTEGDKPGIFFDSVTGFVIVRQDAGVDLLEIREKGLINPRGMADPTSGIRFGYDSSDTLQIVHHLGPNGGGWMSIMDVGGAVPSDWLISAGFVFLYTSAAGDAKQRWNLSIPYESGQVSGFPKIITLAGTFVNAAADLSVKLIRITRSTGAETTIGSAITSAAASHTYAAGGYQTDPTLYDYCFEAVTTGLAGGVTSTDGVQNIRATINHYALNPSV